ncbi:MAG: SH3 domain-containing protein [Pseudomonadota bacterium]
MKTKPSLLAIGAACIFGATAASAAAPAVTTTDVNLRAGPSTHFPVVNVVPNGARLVTFGCLADYSWCDVRFGGVRGWLAARYLFLPQRRAVVTAAVAAPAGIPVIRFTQAYWHTHYAARPWVGRWHVYAARLRRPVRRGVRAKCLGAGCSGTQTITGPAGRTISRSVTVSP